MNVAALFHNYAGPKAVRACVPLLFLFLAAAAQAGPPAASIADGEAALPELRWLVLEQGLELALTELPESREKKTAAAFVILRVDPAHHAFSLSMASEVGEANSFADWSRKAGLSAGVNASMYLEDNKTSTGYMRNGEIINNSNIGSRLGAFFVAGRRKGVGPSADIIEKSSPDWRKRLDDYAIVVQNYRLMDSSGKVLWAPGGPMHSIAVVARDQKGRIAFILSQEPLTAERFAHYLKSFPLGLSTVMYVEGGAQAGLAIHLDSTKAEELAGLLVGASANAAPDHVVYIWKGRQSLLRTRGNPDALVPNIIGVKAVARP